MCSIRPIRKEDDAQIAAIVRANLERYHLNIPGTAYFDPELDHLSAYYAKLPEKRCYCIAADAGERVIGGAGFAEFDGFERCAEIQKLYLEDAAKGTGMGRRLLETVEQRAKAMGYRRLYLETHDALQAAIRLYEKMGYIQIRRPNSAVHTTMNLFYVKELA